MISWLCEYKLNAYKCEITEKSHFLFVNDYKFGIQIFFTPLQVSYRNNIVCNHFGKIILNSNKFNTEYYFFSFAFNTFYFSVNKLFFCHTGEVTSKSYFVTAFIRPLRIFWMKNCTTTTISTNICYYSFFICPRITILAGITHMFLMCPRSSLTWITFGYFIIKSLTGRSEIPIKAVWNA